MLGVAMRRICPDQAPAEAARKAYVAEALAVPVAAPMQPAKVVVASKPIGLDRRQLGFMRGGR